MILIDSSGNATTVIADAVAISLDSGATFICTQEIDISAGSYQYGRYLAGAYRTTVDKYTTDGGATWLEL